MDAWGCGAGPAQSRKVWECPEVHHLGLDLGVGSLARTGSGTWSPATAGAGTKAGQPGWQERTPLVRKVPAGRLLFKNLKAARFALPASVHNVRAWPLPSEAPRGRLFVKGLQAEKGGEGPGRSRAGCVFVPVAENRPGGHGPGRVQMEAREAFPMGKGSSWKRW